MSMNSVRYGLSVLLIFCKSAWAGTAVWNDGSPVLESGAYRVEFRKRWSTTMCSIRYNDFEIIAPTGANQAVLNMRTGPDKKDQSWIGTAHGKEEVDSLALTVDGKPLAIGFQDKVEGDVFVLTKKSRLGPLDQTFVVKVSPQGIQEDATFRVRQADETMNFLYAWMHCWSKSFSEWMADTPAGRKSGQLADENRFYLKEDMRNLVLYSPSETKGVVLSYPEMYEGQPSESNQIWHRTIDNKHYFRVDVPREVGQVKQFTCKIAGFSSPPDSWQAEADNVIKTLSLSEK